MRWASFAILAYVTLGLQTGLSAALHVGGAGPNFVLISVVFICLNAPRDTALLAAFLLGALQDLTSQGTMGLYSFSYGLVALMATSARQTVYREHALTHFSLVLAAGILTAVVLALHDRIRQPGAGVRPTASPLFYSAFYSALVAVVVLGALQRMKGLFRFQSQQRGRIPRVLGRR
jgi:rod shape-determining protein MreD